MPASLNFECVLDRIKKDSALKIAELKDLEDRYHLQALECIRRAVEVSNSPDYPPSVITHQLQNHYTMEWIRKEINSRHFIVAMMDGRVVGTGSLDLDEVKAVFVDPGYQRRGVGRELMKELEDYARTVGIKEVVLKSSITAYEFYKKLGYHLVEKISEELKGDTVITYLMKKQL